MDGKGKKLDLLFEDIYHTDDTGVRTLSNRNVTLWADPGLLETVKAVEGVTNCYQHISATQYDIYLDPRYDRAFILAEIEAAILCKE